VANNLRRGVAGLGAGGAAGLGAGEDSGFLLRLLTGEAEGWLAR